MNIINNATGTSPILKTTDANTSRLAEIEVLRAIAVLMVLVEHIPYNLVFWPARISGFIYKDTGVWAGVDLFFAISGFVIARSLLPRLADVTDWVTFTRVAITFWIARAWRLLPSAWLWLTIPLILCVVFNNSHAYRSFPANWAMFVAGILDVANLHIATQEATHKEMGTAFAQWSLSLEEQFYIMLPFAAFFLRRRIIIPLWLLVIIGFIVPNTPLITNIRLWPIALGVLLAIWSPHQSYRECAPTGLANHQFARVGLLGLLLICLATIGGIGLNIVNFFQGLVAVISGILVWLASYDRGYLWQEGWSRQLMEAIAARSYSLYLVHIPVYFAAHEIWFRLYNLANPTRVQAAVMIILAALGVICVAELNHRLVEKPLREHGKRLAAQYRARMVLEPVSA